MKQTHTIGYIETPAVKNLAKTKNALVEKGLIEPTTPNEKISNDLDKNLQELKPENIKLDVKIGNTVGTYEGGGIQFDIPSPTNIKVEDGILTFDAIDVSEYAEFNPHLTYIINVNGGTDIETPNTTFNLSSVLNNGENVIEVKAKVMFGFNTNSDINNLHIQYTKPERYLYVLDAVFDTSTANYVHSVKVDKKVLVYNNDGFKIFDPSTKQLSLSFRSGNKLAADENDAYFFALNSIYKFDKTSESFDVTGKEIGYISDIFTNGAEYSVSNVCIGNVIYFICSTDDGVFITEFDTNTLKAVKTDTISDSKWLYPPLPVVCNNKIYLFGGKHYDETYNNNIYIYDINNKIITTSSKKCPLYINKGYPEGGVASIGNSVYFYGGTFTDENGTAYANENFYRFDVLTENFVILGDPVLPYYLNDRTNAISIDGIIYIFNTNGKKIIEVKL